MDSDAYSEQTYCQEQMMKSCQLQLTATLLALLTLNASATVRYVDLNCTNATPPFTNWQTAAVTIQDAIDAADAGDTVLVANGVYATGAKVAYGRLANRVAVTKPLTLQSVNGPGLTIIEGSGVVGNSAIRCIYMTNGVVLIGFTLTNGATRYYSDPFHYFDQDGGGAWCQSGGAIVSNCVFTGNSASGSGGGVFRASLSHCTLSNNSAPNGGGAAGSTLDNCTLSGNSAFYLDKGFGGGASGSTLNNCVLTGNSADFGGGVGNGALNNCTVVGNSAGWEGGGTSGSSLNNCIVYYNAAPSGNYYSASLTNCCTTPMPVGGIGNFTNNPLFVATNGWSNLRLQASSSCINAGNNAHVTRSNDLDDNPRIVGGTVDIGAYEHQFPSSVLSYAWAQHYSLPTDGSADYDHSDNDGMNNWQEWRCGTDPTNALSLLRLLVPGTNESGLTVTWESVSNRTYFLERGTNFGAPPAFSTLATNLAGQSGTTVYTDTNAVGSQLFYYRVGVQE